MSDNGDYFDQQISDPEGFYQYPKNGGNNALRLSPDRFVTLKKSENYPSISFMRVDDKKAGANWRKQDQGKKNTCKISIKKNHLNSGL